MCALGAMMFLGNLSRLEAAVTTVGFGNITATSALPPESGFPLSAIVDGNPGTVSSLNGFVSNTLGTISFAFDQDYNLASFILWNDVVVNNEGINDFSLRFYDSSDVQITVPFLANYVGPQGQVAPEEYVFASPVEFVRRVELEVISVQAPSFPTRIEIREVDFGVVPEPSAVGLAALGGLLALRQRRRK